MQLATRTDYLLELFNALTVELCRVQGMTCKFFILTDEGIVGRQSAALKYSVHSKQDLWYRQEVAGVYRGWNGRWMLKSSMKYC